METLANEINNHLSDGGLVQVTTYLRSTLYKSQHAGMFFVKNGNLNVKHGKGVNCLSVKDTLLVGIRFGKSVKAYK